jgi:hypothetical protein
MKYIIAGSGSMPLKEIPDAVTDLFARGVPTEVVYVVGPDTRQAVGQTVLQMAEELEVPSLVVALVDETLGESLDERLDTLAHDVVLWDDSEFLSALPDVTIAALLPNSEDESVDEWLEALIDRALSHGVTCLAMNAQMFDIALDDTKGEAPVEEAAPEPVEEAAPDAKLEATPTAAELEALPRTELKAFAKSVNATPTDWRSKASIVTAILQQFADQQGAEPYGFDLDALEEEVESVTAAPETIRVEGIEVPVKPSSPAAPTLSVVLGDLLTEISGAINTARKKLEEMK